MGGDTVGITTGRRKSKALALMASLVALVVVTAGVVGWQAVLWVGWQRMEDGCNSNPSASSGIEYAWSWHPAGFQCTFGDGTFETHLWWS